MKNGMRPLRRQLISGLSGYVFGSRNDIPWNCNRKNQLHQRDTTLKVRLAVIEHLFLCPTIASLRIEPFYPIRARVHENQALSCVFILQRMHQYVRGAVTPAYQDPGLVLLPQCKEKWGEIAVEILKRRWQVIRPAKVGRVVRTRSSVVVLCENRLDTNEIQNAVGRIGFEPNDGSRVVNDISAIVVDGFLLSIEQSDLLE
jgi:hypothetical protein